MTAKECYGPDLSKDASGPAMGKPTMEPIDCRMCKEHGSQSGKRRFEQFVRFDFHDRKVYVVTT